jgi:hypothetical protein
LILSPWMSSFWACHLLETALPEFSTHKHLPFPGSAEAFVNSIPLPTSSTPLKLTDHLSPPRAISGLLSSGRLPQLLSEGIFLSHQGLSYSTYSFHCPLGGQSNCLVHGQTFIWQELLFTHLIPHRG